MKLIVGQCNNGALKRGFESGSSSEGKVILCYHSELKTENIIFYNLVSVFFISAVILTSSRAAVTLFKYKHD